MEALKWHLLPERRSQMITTISSFCRTRPRQSTRGSLLVVGGMDANKGATTIEEYCPRKNSWTVCGNLIYFHRSIISMLLNNIKTLD